MPSKSIKDFGFDTSPIGQLKDYDLKGFIRLPVEPFFIEIMAIIDGKLNFHQAYKKAFQFNFEGVMVPVIGYDELIQNKIMLRRAKDLEDIAQLGKRRTKKS